MTNNISSIQNFNALQSFVSENEPFDELEVYTNIRFSLKEEQDSIFLFLGNEKVSQVSNEEDIMEQVYLFESVLFESDFEDTSHSFMEEVDYTLYSFFHFQNGKFGVLISNTDSDFDKKEENAIQHFIPSFDLDEISAFAKEKFSI